MKVSPGIWRCSECGREQPRHHKTLKLTCGDLLGYEKFKAVRCGGEYVALCKVGYKP